MKKTSQIILLLFIATTATAQEIPGIQKQPKWAMPFYFEDANGERDTVWVGYDPSAKFFHQEYDSVFNEWQKIDTSSFSVILCPGCFSPSLTTPPDSGYKIEITSYENPNMEIGFLNGKMPIMMTWDNSRFYSDSLPYPDIFPRPRARANMKCYNSEPPYWYCYTPSPHPPLILTDYYSSEFQYTRVYRDSFYFDGSGNMSPGEAIGIRIIIVPHTQPVGIKETGKIYADVYPNPFTDAVYIEGISGRYQITIKDITGRVINAMAAEINPGELYKLDMTARNAGVYFITIQNNKSQVTKKLIK